MAVLQFLHADVKMIKMLLKAGAPLAAFDEMGYTATDYAFEASRQSNADYLKKLGLQSKVVEARQKTAACSRKALAARLRSTAYREFVAQCVRAE